MEYYEKRCGFKRAVETIITNKRQKYHGEKSCDIFNGEFNLNDAVVIKKQPGRPLKVLNITDPHFSDKDIRFLMAYTVERVFKGLVKKEKPNLITVTGDMVCAKQTDYSIDRFCDMAEGAGVPWAPVFGNHDKEANCDMNYLARQMMKCPHCVMKMNDPEMGVGNYVLLITEGDISDSTACFIMADSHSSQVNETQLKWISSVCKKVNELTNGKAEISVFFHIPLPEYEYFYNEAYDENKKCWKEGFSAFGEKHEKVCCEKDENGVPVQRGTFDCFKKCGISYVFCGHEHLNNFSGIYNGIRLTYTLKIGHGSGFRPQFNGGTVITVDNGITEIKHITKGILGYKTLNKMEMKK